MIASGRYQWGRGHVGLRNGLSCGEEAYSPAHSGQGNPIGLSVKVLERKWWAGRLKWQTANVADTAFISVLLVNDMLGLKVQRWMRHSSGSVVGSDIWFLSRGVMWASYRGQDAAVITSTTSGTRWLRIKSWLYHWLALWPQQVLNPA